MKDYKINLVFIFKMRKKYDIIDKSVKVFMLIVIIWKRIGYKVKVVVVGI